MKLRTQATAAFASTSLVLLALAGAGSSAPASASTTAVLTLSPRPFYGGQGQHFVGNIGATGVRQVWEEFKMVDQGNTWNRIDGTTHSTAADGSFDFWEPARGMNNIRIRVRAKGLATPAQILNAKDQEAVVDVASKGGTTLVRHASYTSVLGKPLTIDLDSSPGTEPVLTGRQATLQQRGTSDPSTWTTTWSTLATTTLDGSGRAAFQVTPATTGTVTYRVVLGAWTARHSQMGYFPSSPVDVDVATTSGSVPVPTTIAVATAPVSRPVLTRSGGAASALQKYGWGPAIFDFGWEYGEGLDDPPARGASHTGHWLEYSTGSGAVFRHNGGMQIASKYGVRSRAGAGPGDHGTTSMTLQGNPLTYGRWELRMRPDTWESGQGNYHLVAELIPEDPTLRACDSRAIVIADITAASKTIRFGSYTPDGDHEWTGSTTASAVAGVANSYAVEVTGNHVSWFVNGRVVGTTKASGAIPDVPLTVRIAMVGKGDQEMNNTAVIMDWVRGATLKRGRQVDSGTPLTRHANGRSC